MSCINFNGILSCPLCIVDFNIEYSFEIFKTSTFVIPSMVLIWQSALRYYQNHQYDTYYNTCIIAHHYNYNIYRYGYFVSLVLPCLEHSLRRVFAHCNNCAERVLTAEVSLSLSHF